MQKKLISIVICLLLQSCNYSITMVHTEGQATDIVDENASNTPKTTVTIPGVGL